MEILIANEQSFSFIEGTRVRNVPLNATDLLHDFFLSFLPFLGNLLRLPVLAFFESAIVDGA